MAINEACKHEIQESVDKVCSEEGITKTKAFADLKEFYNDIGVPITFGAVKTKYFRAKKEKVSNETKDSKPQVKHDVTVQPLTDAGGARKGAGRKVRADLYCGVCNEEFKNSYPMWHCNVCFKHLEMNVSECVYCHKDIRPEDRIPHTLPMEKPAEEEKPELKHTETHAVANGLRFASVAIVNLEMIKADDPERKEGFELVIDWIINHE